MDYKLQYDELQLKSIQAESKEDWSKVVKTLEAMIDVCGDPNGLVGIRVRLKQARKQLGYKDGLFRGVLVYLFGARKDLTIVSIDPAARVTHLSAEEMNKPVVTV